MKLVSLLMILFCSSSLLEVSGQIRILETPTDFELDGLREIDFSKRKKVFKIASAATYTTMATGLYFAWYDQFEQESFHFFDDWGEWNNMDKAGHVYSAHIQAELIHSLARWSGYDDDKALLIGTGASLLGQLTIEVMDGFSSGWGFSVTDLGANLIGTSSYYLQHKYWGEQRLTMKMSYYPVSYPDQTFRSESGSFETTLRERSEVLFGERGIERFLKDYNGQTIWVSADIKAFFPESKWPDFLNVALGYSAGNLYGGFSNRWEVNDENLSIDSALFPRSQQWVLALDYDLKSIKARSEFGQGVLRFLDIFKWPAPAVSYDTEEGWGVHLIFLN